MESRRSGSSSPDLSMDGELTIFNARIPGQIRELCDTYDFLFADCSHQRNALFLFYVFPMCLREIQRLGRTIFSCSEGELITQRICSHLHPIIQLIDEDLKDGCDFCKNTRDCIFIFLADISVSINEVQRENRNK